MLGKSAEASKHAGGLVEPHLASKVGDPRATHEPVHSSV